MTARGTAPAAEAGRDPGALELPAPASGSSVLGVSRIRQLRAGEQPPAGEPRRFKNAQGYVRLRWRVGPFEFVECYEHRLIAEAKADEHVHHVNGIKGDNRLENLRLVSPGEHSRHHHSRIDEARATALYAEGLSTPQIAKRLECDAASVWRLLRRNGVATRSISESLERGDIDRDVIRRMKLDGASNREIARTLGCSSWAVDRRVKEMAL